MRPITSQVRTDGADFERNANAMSSRVDALRQVEANILGTEQAFAERARRKGKLLPRERLALLLDRGAPFVALCSIAGYQMFGDQAGESAGGHLIAGIGFVSGRRCMVIVWNYAVKGGTITGVTVKKMLRLQTIARQNKLPIVSLSESGGGDLSGMDGTDPWGANVFIDGGVCYGTQAKMMAEGIPQIVVAHGNATAGGAYHVALSDHIVLVREQTQLFLAGPPLLKAATGADADAETLGGADMHATVSGTGEYLASDDRDGIRIARDIVSQLPKPDAQSEDGVKPPRYDPEELIGLIPEDPKQFYDVRDVIARLVDDSAWLEFSGAIDQGTVCGYAAIGGHRVGLVGNNGPITPQGAKKAAQFLQLCDQADCAVIFLHNTTGFLVGVEAEHGGQVKHGSKLIQAVANLRTTKISLVLGNSYGAGNYAMASRALAPHFIFSWPTAKTAVMGGAQAAQVLRIVADGKLKRAGIEATPELQAQIDQQADGVEQALTGISDGMYCSARMFDDGMIDPRDSRKLLRFLLDTRAEAARSPIQPSTFGVQRL